MRSPFGQDSEFEALLNGKSAGVDLVRIALEISKDFHPDQETESYVERVDALADRARARCVRLDDPRQVLGQINWVLYVEEGFRGNQGDYYDPRNSHLNEVIDRKIGIPLTLALIYQRIGRRLDLDVGGVNTPSHFLLRVEQGNDGPPIFVDPFHEGRLLDREGCRRLISEVAGGPTILTEGQLEACSPRVVVARMLCNLKAIHLSTNDEVSLVPIQRRIAALLIDDPTEQRDMGMLLCRLERPFEALPYLEAFVDKAPGHPDVETVGVLLRAIRRESALRN